MSTFNSVLLSVFIAADMVILALFLTKLTINWPRERAFMLAGLIIVVAIFVHYVFIV